MTQTLTAMFASRAEAETARQMLVDELCLDRFAARLSSSEGMSDTGHDAAAPYGESSFFGNLKSPMLLTPGTAASRAVNNALGTNISGANPSRA